MPQDAPNLSMLPLAIGDRPAWDQLVLVGYGAAAWGGIEAALDLKSALLALEGVTARR